MVHIEVVEQQQEEEEEDEEEALPLSHKSKMHCGMQYHKNIKRNNNNTKNVLTEHKCSAYVRTGYYLYLTCELSNYSLLIFKPDLDGIPPEGSREPLSPTLSLLTSSCANIHMPRSECLSNIKLTYCNLTYVLHDRTEQILTLTAPFLDN